jgi:type II secretory pathway pseudopilin PulG
MPEILSFLVTAILILYIIKVLARILMPMFFQSVVNKAQQQQQNYQQNQQQNYKSNAQPGKIKVEYIPENKKGTIPDSEGEFVNYEEVK